MSSSYQPPSPPPPPSSDTLANPQPQYSTSNNGYNADANPAEAINVNTSQPTQSASSSIIIVIIVIASSIIVSASIYILLRFFSRRHRQASFHSFSPRGLEESLSRNRPNENTNTNDCGGVLESLPIFTFSSVTGNLKTGDCAVCLSKFETQDQLRLLPLCCHAFHAQCIDTWLSSNLTCPLCRSSVNAADSADLSKILLDENARINNTNVNGSDNGGSFRIEIGSISRRGGGGTDSSRRSYSIGSFDYIVDDSYQVSVDSTHWRDHSGVSIDKELPVHVVPAPPGENLSREVSTGGRSWLREYFDRIGSLSFRSSGRLNSRQSEVVPVEEELDEHRAGEEISELFRWLSGV